MRSTTLLGGSAIAVAALAALVAPPLAAAAPCPPLGESLGVGPEPGEGRWGAGWLSPVSCSAAGGTTPPRRHEAEDRLVDAGACAPDGERMSVADDPDHSGGAALLHVHDGCWSDHAIRSDGARSLTLRASAGRSEPNGECGKWSVLVDGDPHGETPRLCARDGMREVEVSGGRLRAGEHRVRVTFVATDGPPWQNGTLDHLVLR